MAAMPSVGRIAKIVVAGVAAAALGVFASSASASEAWLWACHGPNGEPVPMTPNGTPKGAVTATPYGDGCATQSTTVAGGGVRLGFRALNDGEQPAARDAYTWSIGRSGLEVLEATMQRRTNGFAAAEGSVRYAASLSADTTESVSAGDDDVSGTRAFKPAAPSTPPRTALDVNFSCDSGGCAGAAESLDIASVGLRVNDTTPPRGDVARNSPITILAYEAIDKETQRRIGLDEVVVRVYADDAGVGLGRAVLNIDGIDRASANIGNCTDITPGGGQVDLPWDASRCLSENRSTGGTELKVTPTGLAAGIHHRKVTLYDAVGNATVILDEDFEILRPEAPISSRELSIGTSNLFIPDLNQNVNPPGGGGTAGSQAGACRSPRLSMSLNQKPLRISKGIPVLQAGKRYKFRGRLTCVLNGKRRSAPKRTAVLIYNKVGKKTVRKPATRVGTSGRLNVKLKYPAGKRTLIFRFTNADRQRSQVQIKIRVVKKKAAKR